MRYLYTIRKKGVYFGFFEGYFPGESIGIKLFVNICSKVYYGKNIFEDTLAPF